MRANEARKLFIFPGVVRTPVDDHNGPVSPNNVQRLPPQLVTQEHTKDYVRLFLIDSA